MKLIETFEVFCAVVLWVSCMMLLSKDRGLPPEDDEAFRIQKVPDQDSKRKGYTPDKSISVGTPGEAVFPTFDVIIKEIDANIGETVLLPCTVRNLGDKVVSWIRTKDLSILTSGSFTFSADNRLEAVCSVQADFWGLRIRGVKVTDTGQYECQVNTDPKMNLAVNLTVAGAKQPAGMSFKYTSVARITSPKEVYVRAGSPVSLTCEITPSSDDSRFQDLVLTPRSRVQWLHAGKEITSETDRSGVSVDTDYRDRKITSRLRVSMVTSQDGGLYTCSQSSARHDSVKLNIVEGEHSEAMQRDAAFSSGTRKSICFVSAIVYLLLHIT